MGSPRALERTATGVDGLDHILCGGFASNRIYLIDGSPGVGKTTLAMQFLLEGVRRGERCLYVTLSETRDELDAVADSHGWSLDGIEVVELSQVENLFKAGAQNTLFQPAEVELTGLSELLISEFDRVRPARMVLDSLSEVRLMAQNPLRYRRQILAFKHHFATSQCTVLLLDDRSASGQDAQVHSIVHGMITLEVVPLKFGINRRYLSIAKMRGSTFREGNHDYVIKLGGVNVFPRLVASEHDVTLQHEVFKSGNAQLDEVVGGGLDSGTGTLFMGPAGSGKSTIASMFAAHAANRGHRVIYFAFDEVPGILVKRAKQLGLGLDEAIKSGRLELRQIDPAEIAPGELANEIIEGVNRGGVRLVVLDSLNGYVNAMPQEEFLHLHLHELLSYLNQRGVATIMVLAQHGLVGAMGAPVDVSYLADTVLLTRFFEARGAMKKAISIIKKRSGAHEDTIRELRMSRDRVIVGDPLVNFEGVMTGVPRFLGGQMPGGPDRG
ncbi:MAG TPA: ATPase domain-containing protein [Usitatibacter sp.]|jgi:circadian clock protein KaiC|nr:ATPase domain-containing protein [Usitatibacter sp.]